MVKYFTKVNAILTKIFPLHFQVEIFVAALFVFCEPVALQHCCRLIGQAFPAGDNHSRFSEIAPSGGEEKNF
jgi:hypothetical protein